MESLSLQAGTCRLWGRLFGKSTVGFILLAGGAVQKLLGGRLRKVEAVFAESPFIATLMVRLCPVGNNALLNLSAGLSRVSAPRFFAATVVG